MGLVTAFLVALFTEMYGFPLTVYLLSSMLGNAYPALNPFSTRAATSLPSCWAEAMQRGLL
jgi:hypothetical protein